jgi:dTDP-4-dehydrorhamnose reductase
MFYSVDSSFFLRKAKRPKYEVLNNAKFIQLRPWTEALNEYLNK